MSLQLPILGSDEEKSIQQEYKEAFGLLDKRSNFYKHNAWTANIWLFPFVFGIGWPGTRLLFGRELAGSIVLLRDGARRKQEVRQRKKSDRSHVYGVVLPILDPVSNPKAWQGEQDER
jgi:hypothetical protein